MYHVTFPLGAYEAAPAAQMPTCVSKPFRAQVIRDKYSGFDLDEHHLSHLLMNNQVIKTQCAPRQSGGNFTSLGHYRKLYSKRLSLSCQVRPQALLVEWLHCPPRYLRIGPLFPVPWPGTPLKHTAREPYPSTKSPAT